VEHRPICVPATPRGVTLFSIAVAAHMLSGNALKRSTLMQLFGRADANIVSPFSASVCLAESRETIEGGEDLLRDAGLFGLYASAMPRARAESWLSELRTKAFDGPKPQQFVTGMAGQKLAKGVMHCCPQCMQEDDARFGLTFWRTVHQVPGVHHCPTHHEPLLGACLDCGLSQGSEHEWNLPALTCPHCGCSNFAKAVSRVSGGYARHLTLVAQMCAGDSEILRPETRAELFAEAFGRAARLDLQQIINMLLGLWQCTSLEEMSVSLGTRITPRFVDKAIHGANTGINPLAQLVLIFLAQELIKTGRRKGDETCASVIESSPAPGISPLAGLQAALEVAGLPATLAGDLGCGRSVTRISADSGIPYPRLRRQLKEVFEQSIDQLCATKSDDVEALQIEQNLRALAYKLHEPLRRNNVFRRKNSAAGWEELRILNRSKVERYLDQGVRTRKQLHYKNSDLGDWCREFDSEWFDTVLPAIPQTERKGGGMRKGKRNSSADGCRQPCDQDAR
jgi:TniQ